MKAGQVALVARCGDWLIGIPADAVERVTTIEDLQDVPRARSIHVGSRLGIGCAVSAAILLRRREAGARVALCVTSVIGLSRTAPALTPAMSVGLAHCARFVAGVSESQRAGASAGCEPVMLWLNPEEFAEEPRGDEESSWGALSYA